MVAPAVIGAGIGAASDLVGGLANQYFANKASDETWKREKKVLQNQIQWRVEDAVKAGLHPLVGAGISPASGPSAVQVGTLGDDISRMGQNIGRAAEAYLTPVDKMAARSALLDMETREVNLDIAKAQLAGAQKALLTQGATPGVASIIPNAGMPRGKSDKLAVGGKSDFVYDAANMAFRDMPGANAQYFENELGEFGGELAGVTDIWQRLRNYPVWPGVLGY